MQSKWTKEGFIAMSLSQAQTYNPVEWQRLFKLGIRIDTRLGYSYSRCFSIFEV